MVKVNDLFSKYLNKYCVVWFNDGKELRKAKGFVTSVTENYIELVDREYGSIVININSIIKVSTPNLFVLKTKGEPDWKTQE